MLKLFCFLQLDLKTLSVAIRFLWAKSPEQWAAVDLDTHYSEVKDALSSVQSFAIYVFGCSTGEKNCFI